MAIALTVGCATADVPVVTTPKFPDLRPLTVPAALRAAADVTEAHEVAWKRLQSGDVAGAKRDWLALVKRSAGFYPAEAGLGDAALADRDYREAAVRFGHALAANKAYLPALDGAVQAQLGLGDDPAAVNALEALLKVEPKNDRARTRLDLLRARSVQSEIDAARKAREAGQFDRAQASLDLALQAAPGNPAVLRELALVASSRGRFDQAETRAREAIQADPSDAESLATLGAVLEKAGKFSAAADAYGQALAIDSRPAWRDAQASLRNRSTEASMPSQLKSIASASSATRADVAALIGTRLSMVMEHAPPRFTVVASDVRGTWAERWIIPVAAAGMMEIYPNHTFQPEAIVSRLDVAKIVATLLRVPEAVRDADLARWQAAKPKLADLAAGHAAYPSVALAIACGAMATDADRFRPSQPVTGAELTSAIARLRQIASR